jgi:preprotein translocase subunit SecB
MADQTEIEKAADEAEQQPQMKAHLLTQYIRDLSFVNIVAQQGLEGSPEADIQVKVDLDAKKKEPDDQYEVIIGLNIDAKTKEKGESLYPMEIEYGGVFRIENVPDDHLHPFLLIECSRILFPYVRRIVSETTRDAGFTPLNLENVDFVKLYRDEMTRRAAANEKKKGE